jgi:hypothetical protein
MTDNLLEQKILSLQNTIQKWAEKNHIWLDSVFRSYLEHFNDEPNEYSACVTVLCPGSYMHQVVDGDYGKLSDQFENLIDKTEFWFERDSDCIMFYASDEELNKEYLKYFEWQWIISLVQPEYTDLYSEVYDYFHTNPKKLYSLTPRKTEILVSEIFRNQGYRTELGPGKNDKGIDVTLVQVKKYKDDLPIRFEAVASFSAIVEEQKANRGLFITTSRYLPQAKQFAQRQKNRIVLADSTDMAHWCKNVRTSIVRDKSEAIQNDYIINLLNGIESNNLVGKIVVAQTGYNTIRNQFAIVLKDTSYVSLLMCISSKTVKSLDPPYNFRGYEIADTSTSNLKYKDKEHIFRAQKSYHEDGSFYLWGQQTLFNVWDGEPLYFDWID